MSDSTFTTVLAGCGVQLSTEENSTHVLAQELSLVVYKLQEMLVDPIARQNFLQELKEYLQDEESLRLSIMKTTLRKPSWKSERKQDSLMHLFMTIDYLQDVPKSILLDRLPHKILDNDIGFVIDALQTLSLLNKINNEDELASSLLELMDVSEVDIKCELLKHLPLILLQRNSQVVQKLLALIEENEQLAGPILECLQAFLHSQEVKTTTLMFIYSRLLTSHRYLRIFPTVLELLLHHDDDISLVLSKTRLTMDKVMLSDMEDVKVTLHKLLVTWTSPFKQLYNTILKAHTPDGTKPIDIYLLMLLYCCVHEYDAIKRKQLEVLIKQKVRGKSFTLNLWAQFIDQYLVEANFQHMYLALLNIAVLLIEAQNSKNVIFSSVGTLIYKKLFTHKFSDQNVHTVLISKIMRVLMNPNIKNVDGFLKLLLDLSNDNKLEEYSKALIDFINLHDSLSTKNMKMVFEIVSRNVVKDEILLNTLHQSINKLLMSLRVTNIKKGIVGAVMLAKYLSLSTSPSTSMLDESCVSDAASYQLAIKLLDHSKEMCCKKAVLLGLFYDELEMAISNKTSEKVLHHLHFTIQNVFETDYVTVNTGNKNLQVPLKVQFDLNSPDEVEQPFCINIGELMQEGMSSRAKVTILPTMFRFLRTITMLRHEGNIDNIDALLGCGVLLPNIEDLDLFGQADLPLVANCTFHCINLFRELVSAFVTQSGNDTRLKVVQRLEHIIVLEDKLDEVLSHVPDHILPQSYFYDESDGRKVGGRWTGTGTKRTSDVSIDTTASASTSKGSKRGTKKRYYCYREIDSGVVALLKYPVISEKISASQAKTLHRKQFLFLLRDFVEKLDSCMSLRPMAWTRKNVTTLQLLQGVERLMPYIHKQFRLVARDLFSLLENNDVDDPNVLCTPAAIDLKATFDLVINLYQKIFSWPGLVLSDNEDLMKKFLAYFHTAETSTLTPPSQTSSDGALLTNEMKLAFISNLSNYKAQCLLLSSASAMLEVLITMRDLMSHQLKDADKVIVQTANTFLKRAWFTMDGTPVCGRETNEHLKRIITAYLDNATVRTIKGIVNTLSLEIQDFKSKKDTLQTFRAIDKVSINVFVKCVCIALNAKLRSEIATSLPSEQLILWQLATHTLQSLIDIVKKLKYNTNFLTLAKITISLMNLFIKNGFKTIEECLRKKPKDVEALFATWQTIITRFLHRLSCETINKRMKIFLNIIPALRATLEKFVMKVESTMETSKCTMALYTAVLVNRNMDGDQILTQDSSTSDEGVSEEEMEEESDDIFGMDIDSVTVNSASEVFD